MIEIAYVEWWDAVEHGRKHKDEKALPRELVYTSGFVAGESERDLNLALYFDHTEDMYEPIISICKENIKRIRRFKIKPLK